MGRQLIGRFGIKTPKAGRIVRTGRVVSPNSGRSVRDERPLRPKRKTRLLR